MDAVLSPVDASVSTESNNRVLHPFSTLEVRNAFFQMHLHPNESSTPDGFSLYFFQLHWDLVGESVACFCLDVLNHSVDISVMNHTLIALITKITDPRKMSEFWPISLCFVLYKIVTKCLANRLKPELDSLIAEIQNAFVMGRLITDNTIVGFKCMHKLT